MLCRVYLACHNAGMGMPRSATTKTREILERKPLPDNWCGDPEATQDRCAAAAWCFPADKAAMG